MQELHVLVLARVGSSARSLVGLQLVLARWIGISVSLQLVLARWI